jgi:hypothetical protein
MMSHITAPCLSHPEIEAAEQLFDDWFDPTEATSRTGRGRAC